MVKKDKPLYLKVRLPVLMQTGGPHKTLKGGKYRRHKEKERTRKEVRTELE